MSCQPDKRVALCAPILWIALQMPVHAADLDSYRYVLRKSTNEKVCRQMEARYNKEFVMPWKRPALAVSKDDPAYGPRGDYAYPKFDGVIHDNRKTLWMSYSKLPTSAEFDAIQWREGRYRFSTGHVRELPMLAAEFDINNDGVSDLVIKTSFMAGFEPAEGSAPGGEDTLLVFKKGDVDLNQTITFGPGWRPSPGADRPALITFLPSVQYRLFRPFILDGTTYISAYRQKWRRGSRVPDEYVHVLLYRGVDENSDTIDQRNVVRTDRVCEFAMTVVNRR